MLKTLLNEKWPELEAESDESRLRMLFEEEPPQGRVITAAPKGEEQVADLLETAAMEGFKILTYHGIPLPPEACAEPAVLLTFGHMKSIRKFDTHNLTASVDRGVTYTEMTTRCNGSRLKLGHPLFACTQEIVASAGARDAPMCSCRYPETPLSVMKVVLAGGRKLRTGANALSEECVDWAGDGGPYLSQWYHGARDALGIVTGGSVFLYPADKGRRILCYRFGDLEQGLAAMKEISRRQYAWEAMLLDGAVLSSLEGKSREANPYLIVGINVFEELATHFENKVTAICASNNGRPDSPPPLSLLDTAHRPTAEAVLPFYSQYRTMPAYLEEVKACCAEAGIPEPHLAVMSLSRGRSVLAYLVFGRDPKVPSFLETLMDRLYDKGALFDMLPYRLQQKLLRKNQALWDQLVKVKRLLDPENTLNPHEIPLSQGGGLTG